MPANCTEAELPSSTVALVLPSENVGAEQGAGVMVMLNCRDALDWSVAAFRVKLYVPLVAGVPVMVLPIRLRPGGRLPAVRESRVW